jgi:hydroxyethylthiazole kinase-like uncharacterized protein yjeF
MVEVLTAQQMRALEQAAIESGAVTGCELMECAGNAVVAAILEHWPEFAGRADGGAAPRPAAVPRDISEKLKRAVVLCGPGNNGGDGCVVARLLRLRGWAVEVFFYGDAAKLPADAKVNYQRWCALGDVHRLDAATLASGTKVQHADLVVDALLGTGLTRPVDLPLEVICEVARNVVAIDVPSGLCSDSGRVIGAAAVQADLTVTFHAQKLGHVLADGPQHCGTVRVASIGLEGHELPGAAVPTVSVDAPDHADLAKGSGAHKFSYGHALILSGGAGQTGAARLAARGALRIGAGLVTLGVSPAAQMEVAGHVTAVMLRRVEGADGLEAVLQDARINALCLGPGLGHERARALVPVALAAERATVLDADALSAYSDAPDALFDQLHKNCVLTPHGGEFARLFPDLSQRLAEPATRGPAYSKVDATRDAAARAGCTILFKGADTVIADETGVCAIHAAAGARAAPWLATAGGGDVLAGFITGLLARGLAAHDGATTGAWLHADCARHFGPGLIAEDLPEQLPHVFRKLGL